MAACRKEASAPHVLAITAEQRIDRPAFNRCMVRRGYTPRLER
jgi:hypothetical protein